jgi:hypothetical protein
MEGVTMDSEKERAVWEWTPLKGKHELRNIIGLYTYYQTFITGFVDNTKLMTQHMAQHMAEKHVFQWSTEAEATLWSLKESLHMVPVPGYLRLLIKSIGGY